MFDTFPYDEWSEEIAGFWTWGPGGSDGTYVLTVIGCIVMVVTFIGFVILENVRLMRRTDRLKQTGALDRPPPASSGPTMSEA